MFEIDVGLWISDTPKFQAIDVKEVDYVAMRKIKNKQQNIDITF